MQTIIGQFDSYEHATAAVHALNEAGIAHADISFVANTPPDFEPDEVGEGATTGAEVGAGLGAAGGLLAGLGIIAVPGLGPVVAAGWLFATAIGAFAGAGVGAATGGLIGAFTSAGVPETQAKALAEKLERGGAIVSARVGEAHAGPAVAILGHAEGIVVMPQVEEIEATAQQIPEDDLPPPRRDADYPFVPPIV
ncbi:MAG TPA: hypothetical protein VGV07_04445 [Devosia sp.]|jgi:hypothetical protein|uniref:hypothetical protein n=1 Tax=Devosia sp. TaxID=1871048 RepID=UPI002DDDB6ED|nr:hypothetical protein [Devosia sp.]HEV2514473.1 hypothetical protein [Devosia sp.]